MQVNSRALVWGGALCAIVLVIAALVVPFVYVALALAVLLLVALVVVNRMREASDADREADNDESTARLGTLVDDPDYEPYDASTFDSAMFTPQAPVDRYDHEPASEELGEPAQFEEFAEPEAEWTSSELDTDSSYVADDERTSGYETTSFQAEEYTSAFESPGGNGSFVETPAFTEPVFEEYTGPSRDGSSFEVLDDPVAEFIIDDIDASTVLADEGIIDESKVTTAETVLAASQVSRFEPETMTDEESNEETREILGRVAALLAKYE